ncbi:MAG TPA: hypothetical protein PKD83_11815 [Ignavibacteria bacterium]|nr:hypothetical protein [Ignavibacteria bacterium]
MNKNRFVRIISLVYFTMPAFLISCGINESEETVIIDPILIGKGSITITEGLSQQNVVITDTCAWNELKSKMDYVNYVSGSFTETEINFSDYMILASLSEIRGIGGCSIEMILIEEFSEIIEVTIENKIPRIGLAIVCQDYHIVKIPKTNKHIIFK